MTMKIILEKLNEEYEIRKAAYMKENGDREDCNPAGDIAPGMENDILAEEYIVTDMEHEDSPVFRTPYGLIAWSDVEEEFVEVDEGQ